MTEEEQRVEIALRTLAIPYENHSAANDDVLDAANAVLLEALAPAPKPTGLPTPVVALLDAIVRDDPSEHAGIDAAGNHVTLLDTWRKAAQALLDA